MAGVDTLMMELCGPQNAALNAPARGLESFNFLMADALCCPSGALCSCLSFSCLAQWHRESEHFCMVCILFLRHQCA